MSVINTMLRDLDERRGRSSGEAIRGDVVRSVKRESPWHLGRNALLLTVAIAVTGLAAGWWLQQRNGLRASPIVIPAPPVPVLAATPPPNATQVPAAAPVSAPLHVNTRGGALPRFGIGARGDK